MDIVDAYTHCGLSKYEPIENVRAVMDSAGVSRAVLVQHLGEFDNAYIGSVVEAEPERYAGVLMVDHRRDDVIARLEHWTVSDHFAGIRLTTAAVRESPPLFAAAGDLGLVIVLYAPEGISEHIAELEKQLEQAPFTRLAVSHLGTPAIRSGAVEPRSRDVFRLAKFANVYLQLSGMGMFCPHPHEALHGFIAEALEHFGAHRMLWGSNYPVVGSADDYRADLRLLLDGGLPIPAAAVPQVAGENAKRLWFD
jgi:predicted TIM-barrel fold metal-dependent hydrolase